MLDDILVNTNVCQNQMINDDLDAFIMPVCGFNVILIFSNTEVMF